MKRLLQSIVAFAPAAVLLFSWNAFAAPAPAKARTKTAAAVMTPKAAPSDKDIADAKAKGLVWVNTSSKVYHRDDKYYGKTKHGKFMTEEEAQKAGYRSAKPSPFRSKKAAAAAVAK